MTTHLAPVIFVQVLRAYLRTTDDDNWLTALADGKLSRALDAMHVRHAKPWTLPALARLASMSHSSFAQRFRARVGPSPMAYLAKTRIQVACELLQKRDLNVAAIAKAVGYESESAFSAAFNKAIGRRPGAYARTPVGSHGPPR